MNDENLSLQYFVDAEHPENLVIEKLTSDDVEDITIPQSYGGRNITEINPYAFSKHVSLMSVALPDTITDIWDGAFDGCSNLSNIDIPNKDCLIHTAAFRGCTALEMIVLPESLEYLWDSVFENCKNLCEVILPKNLKVISEFAFMNCYNLNKIVIPEGTVEIKDCAFKGCSALKEVTIPASVNYIGEEVFDDCHDLTIFGLPNSRAKEFADAHKIPFHYLNSLVIGHTSLSQNALSQDVSGNGWKWTAESRVLALQNYNGGPISRYGSDLHIVLEMDTENSITSTPDKMEKYGISSHGHSVIVDGDGSLIITSVVDGIYASDSVIINSGSLNVSGINHGVVSRKDNVVVSGGTLSAYASGEKDVCYAVYGKLQCSGAKLYVARDNSSEPFATDKYMRQKYACITHDENCTFEKAKTIFNNCTFDANSQVITGSVRGNVIGNDNVINRSDLSVSGTGGSAKGNVIGNDNSINRSNLSVSQMGDSKKTKETKNRFCPGCGAKIEEEDALFCTACGRKLKVD